MPLTCLRVSMVGNMYLHLPFLPLELDAVEWQQSLSQFGQALDIHDLETQRR